jgi:hypothetical protein
MMAGLSDGMYVDIDESPFLQALIQSKLAAGATAADIETLLKGFNIDADVTEFAGTMAEMEALADGASSSVVQDLTYSQDVEVDQEEVDESHQQMAFTESYTPGTPILQSH